MGLLRRSSGSDVRADAKVVAIAPTRRGARETGRRNVEFELRLEVPCGSGHPVEVAHVTRVPWDRVPFLGQPLPVTLRDGDPGRLSIRWDDAPSTLDRARASAAAAQRGDSAGAAEALGYRLRD
jgi:hypothetical protein